MSWDQCQDYFLLDETRRGALREDKKGRRHEIEMEVGEGQRTEARQRQHLHEFTVGFESC